MKTSPLRCLILPADAPPRRSSIKRQLLFFDAVTIVDPEDQALVNDFDLRETFPGGTEIRWTSRAPFPRTADYVTTIAEILSETRDLQSQGKIQVLSRAASLTRVDPGTHWSAYLTAISSTSLVRAAIPDYQSGNPPVALPNGVYTGGGLAMAGYPSRYEVDAGPPATLPNIEESWNGLAWIRAGRHLKYTRLAAAIGAAPLSLDEPNRQMSLALSVVPSPSIETLADYAIAADSVDPVALDQALQSLTWKETLEWRKKMLPHVAKLRMVLLRNTKQLQTAITADPKSLPNALSGLRSEYLKAKEDVQRKWIEFGIAIASKGVAAVTASELGLSMLPSLPITDVVMKLVTGAVAAGAVVSSELKALIPARTHLRAHPLAFFDTLPTRIRTELP